MMNQTKAFKIFAEEFSEETKRAVENSLLADQLWHRYILNPTKRNHDIFLNVCKALFYV